MTTRADRLAVIRSAPTFLYVSRPGDGKARYVFERKTCLGLTAAYAYALELHIAAMPPSADPFANMPNEGR